MDNTQLKCPMCDGQFNTQEKLNAHAKEMHEKKEEQPSENALVCTKCGFKANTTDELTEHNSQHQTM